MKLKVRTLPTATVDLSSWNMNYRKPSTKNKATGIDDLPAELI